MSAQIYDPTALSITDRALEHVRRQLSREGANALQLGVTESGCNGYMYELDYIESEPTESATLFEFGDDESDSIRVYVRDENWELVRGTEIDFVTEGLNSALKFNNPNAETLCGCGESFSVSGT